MFRAPTFTGEPLVMSLVQTKHHVISEKITDSANTVTVSGTAHLGAPDGTSPAQPILVPSDLYRGLEVGMSVTRERTFTPDDVADYLTLVDDPNPRYAGTVAELPPPLLGGMVSWLLGVELPGRGTNWLKQHYSFHRTVHVPAKVTTTVTITRLRPEKGLVNLATTCATRDGVAVSGEALVLAIDVADR
jgi:acyl dehydratase